MIDEPYIAVQSFEYVEKQIVVNFTLIFGIWMCYIFWTSPYFKN